jgi:hypothetical protein
MSSTAVVIGTAVCMYEIKPDQPAPVAVACRDAKSNPCFTRTVVLQITSMGNLSEK